MVREMPGIAEVRSFNRVVTREIGALADRFLGRDRSLGASRLLVSAVRLHLDNPRSRAAQSCIARYFEELAARFEAGFDPTLSIPVAAEELTPPRGCFILATLHGEPVGCGGLRCHAACGEIK